MSPMPPPPAPPPPSPEKQQAGDAKQLGEAARQHFNPYPGAR